MPVRCKKNEKGCYCQWGNQSKYYYNCNSEEQKELSHNKAKKQGAAIEITKGDYESYSDYPQYIKDNALKGIRLNENVDNKCATQVGKVRAQQLSQGKPISKDTINRMYSYLSRAMEYFNPNDNEACGTISVYLWGGPEALQWSERKLEQINKEEFSCECGADLEQHINEINYDFSLTPKQKEEKIKELTSYNDFITDIENNFDFDSIGKEYKTIESNALHFYSIPSKQFNFRVINLYKYEPQPGSAPIIDTTRRFCAQLYLRTSSQNNYLTFAELQSLPNPGAEYGVRDILRFAGNFTTDPNFTTCRHRWIRYKFDTETGNIVRDITQPIFVPTISNR